MNIKTLISGVGFVVLTAVLFSFGTKEWAVIKTQDGVSVSTKLVPCAEDGTTRVKNLLLLKFKNDNNYKVKVTWSNEKYFDGVCSGCGNEDEHTYSVELRPGQEVAGNCATKREGTAIFESYKDGKPSTTKLTDYKVANMSVVEVK